MSVPCANWMRLSDNKMPSESKPLLTAQTEKPNHYSYLKEFRVEQCPLFLQHKCTQHRPFTCFHWHFMNQRRRRPVRRRDGTFNYSADNYCTKYDETTGICPDGDDCPYLHRTAGDTERRYHLRYYKTCMCVHDTDSRGYCVKNGLHCAFAHGSHDHRPPVYDIKEIQALEAAETDGSGCSSNNGPNALDKERNLMNEDPKWQDTNFVLSNYKTEPCKRPPRLCRQGYACPQYHNSKDKRRSPRKFKYRSTPCPNVKHGEEWGEPGNCDAGDLCTYCHTRTEQQFHPEIYKSTKCNDVQQSGYCPRGVFCAFAHVEQELGVSREATETGGTNFGEILSNVLPHSDIKKEKSSESSPLYELQNGSSDVSESASSSSSIGSNSCSSNKAPGAQLAHKTTIPFQRQNHLCSELTNKLLQIENDPSLDPIEREQRKQTICYAYNNLGGSFFGGNDTVESIVGNAFDDIILDELNISGALERDLENDSPTVVGLTSAGLLGSSAPVNIPISSASHRTLGGFSPNDSPLQSFLSASRFSQSDTMDFLNHSQIQLSNSASKISSFSNFFDFQTQSISPNSRNHNNFSMSPNMNNNLEVVRLRDELGQAKLQLNNWEDRLQQARTACEAWQRETEEANRKAKQLESKLQETANQCTVLKQECEQLQDGPHIRRITKVSELSKLSLSVLKSLHSQIRQDLEEIEKVLYRETASKCMVCEERNRTVTLNCNHFVLCDSCANTQAQCPYCQTPNNLVSGM